MLYANKNAFLMLIINIIAAIVTEQLNVLSLTSVSTVNKLNKSIQWGLFHDAIANSRVYVQGTPTSNQL